MSKKVLIAGLLLLFLVGMVAATSSTGVMSATTAICKILSNIQLLLMAIAGGIGIVVITLQGIKWAGSAEDPGARKQAKQGIIHAVIGLIIVMLAVWIVMIVFTGNKCNIT
jgi:hypothetical protein